MKKGMKSKGYAKGGAKMMKAKIALSVLIVLVNFSYSIGVL